MKTIHEVLETPVADETDVLVCGGGPAGFGAAVAAARAGARTLLLEESNCLGGMATAGMMSHWSGCGDSPLGIEITDRMRRYGANYDGAVAGVPYNEDIHVARYLPGEGFSLDGTAVVASKSMTTWSGTAANLYLGANNPNGGGIDSNQLSPIRIYYCKIWENGVLVRNLVPKQRANDGRNGLYDEVHGGFYGFVGTGTTALVPPLGTVIVVK